jgi:hypothetical protein
VFRRDTAGVGTASLLRSVDRRLTHENIRTIVTKTADDLVAYGEGWDIWSGYGRLNLARAVERVLPLEREIQISVRPSGTQNRINPASDDRLPVAILASNEVNIDAIVVESATFGATGTEASTARVARRDVDADGDTDLVLRFVINETGIACGDQVARLKVRTVDGRVLHGMDQVRTVGCRRSSNERSDPGVADVPVTRDAEPHAGIRLSDAGLSGLP